jgi:hypothetical protein
VIFKKLDVQAKQPMSMLRKIATAAAIETDSISLRSTQPVSEEPSDTMQTSSLVVQRSPPGEGDDDDTSSDEASKNREDLIVVGTNTAAPFLSRSVAATDNITTPSLTLGPAHDAIFESSSKASSLSADIVFKGLRVSIDDPCGKVLPETLQKYNLRAEWKSYAMWIVYDGGERCPESEEKPLAMFRDLEREGMKPTFMLRKRPTENSGVRQEISGWR